MVALKGADIARALEKPDPRWRVWLVYGPDAGLASERVERIVRRALGAESGDPFRYCRLDGDEVASDPLRLLDEANTIGLFGGERVIRIGRTGKALLSAVQPLLDSPPEGACIVIEAGELNPRNPLRVACERSPGAVALPCYVDDGRSLADVVDATLRTAGVSVQREAREALLASLGSDRLVSRQELDKLMLYVGEARRIELADVEAMVGDSALREADAVADAAFTGRLADVEAGWVKLRQEGLDPGVLAGALIRQGLSLLKLRAQLDSGQPRQTVIDAMRMPPARKAALQAALGAWSAPRLSEAIIALGRSVAEARKSGALASEIVQRAIISLTRRAVSR